MKEIQDERWFPEGMGAIAWGCIAVAFWLVVAVVAVLAVAIERLLT